MARATNKHATTHRSRGLGGTDPVPPDLPYMSGFCSSQVITADTEIEWDSVFTGDPDTFLYDTGDPAGILMRRDAIYRFMAKMRVSSGDMGTTRGISVQTGVYSGGPLGGSAVVDAGNAWWSGHTNVTADAWTVTSMLWEDSMRGLFGATPWDPFRVSLVVDHQGSNFTALDVVLYVVKINDATSGGTGTPPPPEEPPP